LIYHLMTSHKALSEHVPQADSCREEVRTVAKKKKKEKSYSKIKKEVSETEDQSQFKCNICKAVTSSKPSLARHMAWVHYKQELRQLYGKTDTDCGICEVKTKDEMSLVRHIASVHDGLKKIMKDLKPTTADSETAPAELNLEMKGEQPSDDSDDASSQ